MLSFGRVAVDSILRNRRRTLYAIIGVTLAVAMVSGSLIAVDSSSYGILRDRLDATPVDFYGGTYSYYGDVNLGLYEDVKEKVLRVDDVVDASYVLSITGWEFLNEEGTKYVDNPYYWSPYGSLMFIPSSDAQLIMERYKIHGEAPAPGTAAISAAVADPLEISVGDSIICSYPVMSWDMENSTYAYEYVNTSYEVSQIWTQGKVEEEHWQWYYYQPLMPGSVSICGMADPVIVYTDEAQSVEEQFGGSVYVEFTDTHLVWIDRDSVIHLGSMDLSIQRLSELEAELERATRQESTDFQTPVVGVISSLQGELSSRKALFIGLSLPVIVLGLYVSVVGVDMGMTDRRRELGVFKSRGASNRQVMLSLMSEALVLGAMAGFSGLIVGLLLSRFLVLAVSGMFDTSGAEVGLSTVFISWSTVISAIVFGTLLMLVSAYRPMKRASKMEVAESLHHYSQKTVRIGYKPKWDIAALAMVGLSLTSVLWLDESFSRWNYGSLVVYVLVAVLMFIGWVMVPVVPFLLSVSVVRLVTRGSRSLYTRFTWLFRSWTKELHYIVEKNIARNPRRAANIGVIVSLAVAFGLFVSITMESELAYAEKTVFYEVGADIRFEGYAGYMSNGLVDVDFDSLEDMDSIDGVRASAMYISTPVTADYTYRNMAVFDSAALSEVVDMDSELFARGGSRDIKDLGRSSAVMISESFAEESYLDVDDSIEVSVMIDSDGDGVSDTPRQFDLLIIGLVVQLPGLAQDLYVDSATLSSIEDWQFPSYSRVGFFVAVEEGEDHADVANSVTFLCTASGLDGYTVVAEQRLEDMMFTPEFRTIRDFLYLEYALSLVMLTCGVGLVLFVTVWDRRTELGCMMARGSSAGQMRRILMGESLSLMTLGMTVGVVSGLLASYLYSMLIDRVNSSYVPRDIVVTWVTVVVMLSAVASFLLASLLATYRAGKIRLAEVLRVRGG